MTMLWNAVFLNPVSQDLVIQITPAAYKSCNLKGPICTLSSSFWVYFFYNAGIFNMFEIFDWSVYLETCLNDIIRFDIYSSRLDEM